MSVRESGRLGEHVEALQQQVTELKEAADRAREETSEQVRARIEQVKADLAAHREPAGEKAGQAAGRPQSQWQSVKADAQAKMRDLQDRIGRKRDELDVKAAEQDAEGAEDDAIDALDFAEWADERAAASRTS